MLRSFRNLSVLLASAVLFADCASSQMGKVPPPAELPPEVPKELKEKFEVKDTVALAPVPVATPETRHPKRGRRHRKKKLAKGLRYPNRRPAKDPIWIGEKQVFDVTWLGLPACQCVAEVLPYKMIDNRKVYHVRGVVTSSPMFAMFYKINDMIETYFDFEGFFSHRFHLVQDESKQWRDSLELYDSEKKQTFFWNRWSRVGSPYEEKKVYAEIPRFAQDSLSALYYMRTLPMTDGSEYVFPVVNEGNHWDGAITVIRREMMDTPLGRVQTVVVRPETRFNGVAKKTGDSFIWFTDDDRRFIVRVEAKVKIGTIVVALRDVVPGSEPKPEVTPTVLPSVSPVSEITPPERRNFNSR